MISTPSVWLCVYNYGTYNVWTFTHYMMPFPEYYRPLTLKKRQKLNGLTLFPAHATGVAICCWPQSAEFKLCSQELWKPLLQEGTSAPLKISNGRNATFESCFLFVCLFKMSGDHGSLKAWRNFTRTKKPFLPVTDQVGWSSLMVEGILNGIWIWNTRLISCSSETFRILF